MVSLRADSIKAELCLTSKWEKAKKAFCCSSVTISGGCCGKESLHKGRVRQATRTARSFVECFSSTLDTAVSNLCVERGRDNDEVMGHMHEERVT